MQCIHQLWEIQDTVKSIFEKDIDSTEAKYASMVEGMDKSLGDIMNFLEANQITDNTIILFMSDNGGLRCTWSGGRTQYT